MFALGLSFVDAVTLGSGVRIVSKRRWSYVARGSSTPAIVIDLHKQCFDMASKAFELRKTLSRASSLLQSSSVPW